jgi:hypothetical protein
MAAAARHALYDLDVLAVAMACWVGERYLQKLDSVPCPGIIASEGVPMNVFGGRRS